MMESAGRSSFHCTARLALQVTLIKQEKVACFIDNDAHLAVEPKVGGVRRTHAAQCGMPQRLSQG